MKENEKRKTQKENQFGLQLATPTFEKMSELVTSRACGQEPLKSQIRREKIHIHWIRIVKTVFFLDCSFIFGVSICKTFVMFTCYFQFSLFLGFFLKLVSPIEMNLFLLTFCPSHTSFDRSHHILSTTLIFGPTMGLFKFSS